MGCWTDHLGRLLEVLVTQTQNDYSHLVIHGRPLTVIARGVADLGESQVAAVLRRFVLVAELHRVVFVATILAQHVPTPLFEADAEAVRV